MTSTGNINTNLITGPSGAGAHAPVAAGVVGGAHWAQVARVEGEGEGAGAGGACAGSRGTTAVAAPFGAGRRASAPAIVFASALKTYRKAVTSRTTGLINRGARLMRAADRDQFDTSVLAARGAG